MVNPERFRTRAEECDAKAETAPDPDLRLLYRDWRRSGAMAQLAQQRSSSTSTCRG